MNDERAAEVAKALGHSLRIGILRALRERQTISAVEYSRESGQVLGNVSYHVNALLDAKVISLSGVVPRRGALEHRYALNGSRASVALEVLDLLAKA